MAPESELVFVNDNFARLSPWVEPSGELTQDMVNAGFVADCILSSWDVVTRRNDENILSHNGKGMRLDNGGSLDYRAQGEKKGTDTHPFDEVVRELELGDGSSLGRGMRRLYPGLTNAQIKQQGKQWKDRVTDAAVDKVIDSKPLPKERREYLKRLVKARTVSAMKYIDSLPDDNRTEP
jgi:hypothetical protein